MDDLAKLIAQNRNKSRRLTEVFFIRSINCDTITVCHPCCDLRKKHFPPSGSVFLIPREKTHQTSKTNKEKTKTKQIKKTNKKQNKNTNNAPLPLKKTKQKQTTTKKKQNFPKHLLPGYAFY